MPQKIGPREMQLRQQREQRLASSKKTRGATAAVKITTEFPPCESFARRPTEPPATPAANTQETDVKKAKTKKAAAKRKPAAKKAKKAKTAKTPKAAKAKKASGNKGVPAFDVAAFICRDGGASMDELVKQFGIEAHPMRAKIHYVRHKLGYEVETKDGRYFGTPPKVESKAKVETEVQA